MKKQILNIIALLTILSLALAACGNQPASTPAPAEVISPNDVVAEGRLEPAHGTNLSFQARGVVEDVLVNAGDSVKQGDVLVRLAMRAGLRRRLSSHKMPTIPCSAMKVATAPNSGRLI